MKVGLKVNMSKGTNSLYSEIHGKKRESEVLTPHIVYDESMGFATNKGTELIFAQHKLMREFLTKKGLIDEYNSFQERQSKVKGPFGEWYRKWN